jgi:adenine-specific DNA-methyltransferase
MAEPCRAPLKQRGAFFTPAVVSRFLAEWAVRSPQDLILEPSCGEAAFLLAAVDCLRSMGSEVSDSQLFGIDIHADSIKAAETFLRESGISTPHLGQGDFFDLTPAPGFDAVIGNPPYIRYQQFFGESRAKALRAAEAQGVRLSGLSSSWAAFVVHASAFLKDNGRLALVLPAELLTVNYAAPVREFLLRRFASVRLVLFKERDFPGVMEEVVLLLAEGTGPSDRFELVQVDSFDQLHALIWESWGPRNGADKWVTALLPDTARELYSSLTADSRTVPLLQWGETTLGMVSGNNKFFTLTGSEVVRLNLPPEDLLKITPPGSRHLKGVRFTNQTWQELLRAGARAYLFYPRDAGSPLSPASAEYVRAGEEQNVHVAYKCRVRTPWWRVPKTRKPDLFLTYMNHYSPRLVANAAKVHCLNSFHGVTLHARNREIGGKLLPIAALNSLTTLSAEIVGRSYGGGLLKVEPKEADTLLLPAPPVLEACGDHLLAIEPQLSKHLRNGQIAQVIKLVDRVLLQKQMGLKRADIEQLRSARELLFSRRAARSRDSRGAEKSDNN